jgi:hypothetical protein
MTVGVNPGDAVLYVEYDIDAVFDWLCEGELDVLIEFVFEELLDANGVFDTLWVVDEEPHGDTEILGLKLIVELADGHDESILEGVNPGDTDGHDDWEEFDDGDRDTSEEGVCVNPGDGVNSVVVDCKGVITWITLVSVIEQPFKLYVHEIVYVPAAGQETW